MSRGTVPSSPIRILAKGSSTVSWISNVEPGRVLHAYPRALETTLHQNGWSALVRVSAPLASSSLHTLRDADDDIFSWDPDVIVLNTGHMENLHLLVPIAFARHVFTRTARPGKWRRKYRRTLLWAIYSAATRFQAKLEPTLAPRVFSRRRNAVMAQVNHYVDVARHNGHPLVVVMGLVPPARPVAAFPGLAQRIELMNAAFRALVEQRAEPDIVWFDPSEALAAQGMNPGESLGDGLHFNAEAHEIIGKRLAEVVDKWAAQQPHFNSPPSEPR